MNQDRNTTAINCYQYSLDGRFIESFPSIRSAELGINCPPGTINRTLLRNGSFSSGYYWFTEYKGEQTEVTHSRIKTKYDVITGGSNCYKEFMKRFPSADLTTRLYEKAIKTINNYYRKHLLETGHVVFLPFGNGKMMIQKNKQVPKRIYDGSIGIKAPLNYSRTKETGEKVYHIDHKEGYNYRYMWFASSSYIKPYSIWEMKMTKESKSELGKYLADGKKNYRPLYRECYSRKVGISINKKLKALNK